MLKLDEGEISYIDAKYYNDKAKELRDRCRLRLQSLRAELQKLPANPEHSISSPPVHFRVAQQRQALRACWNLYRHSQRAAVGISRLYTEQCLEFSYQRVA